MTVGQLDCRPFPCPYYAEEQYDTSIEDANVANVLESNTEVDGDTQASGRLMFSSVFESSILPPDINPVLLTGSADPAWLSECSIEPTDSQDQDKEEAVGCEHIQDADFTFTHFPPLDTSELSSSGLYFHQYAESRSFWLDGSDGVSQTLL